jgi:hypothetical protein
MSKWIWSCGKRYIIDFEYGMCHYSTILQYYLHFIARCIKPNAVDFGDEITYRSGWLVYVLLDLGDKNEWAPTKA